MSNQLYKYISTLIVDYFVEQKISPGDKYNLYLEDNDHVIGLYKELRKCGIENYPFSYTHPGGDGSIYYTFYLLIGETKVIISSSENANEAYFTMLRNQVSNQKNEFEGTAILILFNGKLDSLSGGSGSLIKEGAPLHIKSFKKRLNDDINSTESFKKFEKILLSEVVNRKTISVVEDNNSIFDYAQVIESLVKQKIESKDYNYLGLFPHQELAHNQEDKNIRAALAENFDLYERLENMHLHGNPEVELERMVSEKGKQNLVKEDWGTYDFSKIIRWKEAKEKRVAPIFQGVLCDDISKTIWSKSDNSSDAGKRSNSVIIFNHQNQFPLKFELKFDQPTKTDGIEIKKGKKNVNVVSSGNSLKVELLSLDTLEPFIIIAYKDILTAKLYKFKILQLPTEVNLLRNFETNFFISNDSNPRLMLEEADKLIFNATKENLIKETLHSNKNYQINQDIELQIHVDYTQIKEDIVPFYLTIKDYVLPLSIKPQSEPPKLITGLDVWKNKRQFQTNFGYSYEEDILKLLFSNNEHAVRSEFRKNLLLEKQIVYSDFFSWIEYSDNELIGETIELSDLLKAAFRDLRKCYQEQKGLPSLLFLKDNVKTLAENYVNIYLDELNAIPENKPLSRREKDLVWLGVIKEKYGEALIKYSPLHPLNIAYQLYLNDQLKYEEVYDAILSRLSPFNLVPFIEYNDKVYTPIISNDSPEWIYFTEYLQSEQSVPKNYVTKLITAKIENFTYNFDFLFSQSNYSPIKLNVINLGDCKEVVQGIFEYYRNYLNKYKSKRPSNLLPIDINIYGSDKLVSKFEELAYYDKVEDVENLMGIKLKTINFEKEDLLNVFLEKINFYSKPFPKENQQYDYAHITFYQFDREEIKRNTNNTNGIKSGLSMNGLMADVPSMPIEETYRSGFGSLYSPEQNTTLTQLTTLYNSLVNVSSSGENFERNKAICCTINFSLKDQLENLYTNSQWVTYIDPKVELDFFKEKDDLVIIHYSDQYTNTSGYDAITVSSKTEHYSFIVSEFLKKNKVNFKEKEDTIKVINFFNAINGDWLLKLLRQDNQFPREKISLLSGIKVSLSLLYNPNIIWIPVSLEEILRISGSAGLKMSDGLFSAKNLGSKDFSFSDDLLMIGLERCEGKLRMHLYPMELKIGKNNLINKGIDQGRKTADLLRTHLTKKGFLGEFYRNFFAKLAIVNAEKMKLYKIWDSQQWQNVIKEYRSDLLNNNFEFSTSLDDAFGKFGLIHFGNDTIARKLKRREDYVLAEFLEEDGYNFLVMSIDELIIFVHNRETGIDKTNLLLQKVPTGTCEITKQIVKEDLISEIEDEKKVVEIEIEKTETNEDEKEVKKKVEEVETINSKVLNSNEGIEIAFGTNLNNSKTVFWEPNNTNKVMHTNTGIIGTMGTGKTQFTKSLITQLNANSNKNVGDEKLGILIFDYKGDYIKEDFVLKTAATVLHPYHLPYNPLALDANESSKPMLPLHAANDLKETIANAFNLGNVQKQRLRDVIVEAYEEKGIHKANKDSWMRNPPTLGDVCNIYLRSEKNSQDSLYAAISNLSEFEIFEPDVTKTQSLYSLIKGVVVINLSGYDESIQNLIVAITLDAFYTQMQRHGHSLIKGNNREIKKMILVDEADNFLSKNFNSIRKILKEGREFGVGTILSTQFLNHFATSENEYSNYILTWVIHRVNEIKIKEVESLFSLETKQQRENLIKTIKGLEKHQSIVNLAGSDPILIKDKAFWEL